MPVFDLEIISRYLDIPLPARRLLEVPEKSTTVNLSFHAADGSLVMGQTHVVYYNTCRGPAKGGIRFSPTVTLQETAVLAELMVWKTALTGIPFGGGKSGICIDPHKITRQEKISALKEFVHVMHDDLEFGRYIPAPDMATLLYAIEPTRDGGQTVFANMYTAYDTLADDLKAAITGREVMQVYNYLPTERVDADDDPAKYDHHAQPAVIVHPVTGGRALYVNQLMSARIEGLAADDSRAVLEAIRSHLDRPELSYAHAWRPGDLMMWDNYCTCHARTDFPPDQTRLMRRCTVAGEKLIAA